MKLRTLLLLIACLLVASFAFADTYQSALEQEQSEIVMPEAPTRDFSQRIVFEKYIWAEGDDPKARNLSRLFVKFFDEDTVRIRRGEMVSLTGRDITGTRAFLARHPEIEPRVIISNRSEEAYMADLARIEKKSGWDLVDLFSFACFQMEKAPADPKALIYELLENPEIETAYYEPIPVDLTCTDLGNATPNFIPDQTYHGAAPTGVDLDWAIANYGADIVDGPGTSRYTGIFERGMQTTHEDVTTADVGTTGTPDTDNDHGTAVMGVLGACDDNNVGCLGFLADQRMRLYQRNSSGYASVADIYDLATVQLITGELTNSSWGYFASPLPPGQSCPCNPGQNGVVTIEYDAGVKSAVQAMVADGIHVFLAAGNGCVNMDHATFGTVFRNSTDTGSNYVSAVEAALPHDASCFTNWGERCDLNAWGDASFTLGYGDDGDPFVPTSRDEEYTQSFGGTSNASPTVGGCAGVIHNIQRDLDNVSISTSLMRDYLNDYGTAPGTTPGNIGLMPNLKDILAAEINPDLRAGWTYYMVPRTTNDATGASCVLPTDLNPAPSTTYWNAAAENTARIGWATPLRYRVYRDDVTQVTWTEGDDTLKALETTYGINFGTQVRGGRHFVRLATDYDDQTDERIETNNNAWNHWRWDPIQFANGAVQTYSAPPLSYVTEQQDHGYTDPNVDGFGGEAFANTGYWDIMMVMCSTSTADFDARIYSEDVTSTNGFDTYEASSAYVSESDFVGVNNNVVGQAQELIAAVRNYDGENSFYRVECGTSSILSPSQPGIGRTNYGSHSLGSSELFDVWEFYVNELVPYNIEADVYSGNANIVISVFGPDDDYFGRPDRNVQANSGGAGADEMISCWTPAEVGWHAIVVHKNNYQDWDQTASFTLYVGKAGFDLTSNLNSGWSHELVIRQAVGTVPAVLPGTLTGNIATNYVNAGYINQGCGNTVAGMNDAFYKDGPLVYTTGSWGGPYAPGTTTQWLNQNIGTVAGGRHQIGDYIDINEEGAEWDEANNRHDEQFVWTPYVLTNNVMYSSPAVAPNFRDTDADDFFTDYIVDGFRFTGSSFWSGVGMMPNDNVNDVYNCYIYNPSTSSTSGFSTRLVNSWSNGANTEWVIENGNIHGVSTWDVGVHNNNAWPSDTSMGTYRVQQSNRLNDLVPGNFYGIYAFPSSQIINVFDLNLTAGVNTRIILDNQGPGNLGFAIYNPSMSYGSRTTYTQMVNANGDGADESIVYTPTETGWHGLVVFKDARPDLPNNPYNLIIGDRTPQAPTELVIKWVQSTPDLILELTWEPVLFDVNGDDIIVDRYDLYYSYDLNASWPGLLYGGSLPGGSPTVQVPIYPSDTEAGFQCLFVAVDTDGFIVASNGPDSLVGQSAEAVRTAAVQGDKLFVPKSERKASR
ncbi:MAG: S8 family serine peptidase [Calditrichaeota bacterium]|nr:S8 family serine peptidase [Calditrichota bacterium]